jgi:hypothetical protein
MRFLVKDNELYEVTGANARLLSCRRITPIANGIRCVLYIGGVIVIGTSGAASTWNSVELEELPIANFDISTEGGVVRTVTYRNEPHIG